MGLTNNNVSLEAMMLQRAHLMDNIALADAKAERIYMLNFDKIRPNAEEKLTQLYMQVLTPVTEPTESDEPEGFEAYDYKINPTHIAFELEVLSGIAKAKYSAISKMISVIKNDMRVKMPHKK